MNNQIVSVRRFGTLSPHERPSHLARDLSTGKVRELPATKSVKMHPHESFLALLADKKDRFRKQETGIEEKEPL